MPEPKKPVYLGCFLTEASRAALFEQFPPIHPSQYGDHVTIVFKPTDEEIGRFKNMIGKEADIWIIMYRQDKKGQSVSVVLNEADALFRPGTRAHITISCAEKVSPAYSTEMINNLMVAQRAVAMLVKGVFDTFPRSAVVLGEISAGHQESCPSEQKGGVCHCYDSLGKK